MGCGMRCVVLYCIVLYCVVLRCVVLCCVVLCCVVAVAVAVLCCVVLCCVMCCVDALRKAFNLVATDGAISERVWMALCSEVRPDFNEEQNKAVFLCAAVRAVRAVSCGAVSCGL